MTMLLAVVVVGAGSVAFRLVPLLTGLPIPEVLARGAGWAGLSVIAGITVRSALLLHDDATSLAPLVAVVSVTAGLFLAHLGRGVLTAVGVGCASYLIITAVLAGLG